MSNGVPRAGEAREVSESSPMSIIQELLNAGKLQVLHMVVVCTS